MNLDGSKDGGSPTGGQSRSGSHASQANPSTSLQHQHQNQHRQQQTQWLPGLHKNMVVVAAATTGVVTHCSQHTGDPTIFACCIEEGRRGWYIPSHQGSPGPWLDALCTALGRPSSEYWSPMDRIGIWIIADDDEGQGNELWLDGRC
ncbi:hypothetical protein LZ30DRAFT_460404 [Colletotrichum cereale]|nr:hypothetical protein LZ30DRAFT_460404 [Colletotrichum cereale]